MYTGTPSERAEVLRDFNLGRLDVGKISGFQDVIHGSQ